MCQGVFSNCAQTEDFTLGQHNHLGGRICQKCFVEASGIKSLICSDKRDKLCGLESLCKNIKQ